MCVRGHRVVDVVDVVDVVGLTLIMFYGHFFGVYLMKITKTKLAAASFSAALTSLYSAPELCAQDTVPDVLEITFDFDGVIPFGSSIEVVARPLTFLYGSGEPAVFTFANLPNYGFQFSANFLSSHATGLNPGDVFSGQNTRFNGLFNFGFATGVETFGFVLRGGVGYFRVDLGNGLGDFMVLDAALAAGPNGGGAGNDFAITIPPLPDDDDVVLGDVDGDGDVDFEDIPGFISLLTGGGFQAEADIDGDGDVDFEDIPLFIQLLTGGSVNTQAGLPGLAMGVTGLRARRMAVTA